jgi:tripartite-type tricarboxylate transporter receptor subunit TctC
MLMNRSGAFSRVLSALPIFSTLADAQQPLIKRTVNLYVGFAAGGPADVLARLISEKLKDHIGQSVIVQNRPGAGGTIAAAAVAKAEPDGTNLLLVSSGHAGAPALFPNLPYDQKKDFVPVIALAQSPIVILVDAKSSFTSIQQLVDAAKAAPGKLNFGTGGGGATLTALAAILLRREVGFDAAAVYFPGSGPANIALLGGTIDFSFDTVSGAIGLIIGNSLRPLAVTSAKRSAVLPSVPTVAETVHPGFEVTGWFGILAPAGLDPAIREQLNHAINEILLSSDIGERLATLGLEPLGGTPADFSRFINFETTRWSGLIRELNLKAD